MVKKIESGVCKVQALLLGPPPRIPLISACPADKGEGQGNRQACHCLTTDYASLQIAKDVKQFYDQALNKAVMEDNAGNAKTVVKSFHETVRAGNGTGQQTLLPHVDGVGGVAMLPLRLQASCLSSPLSSLTAGLLRL